MIENENKTGIYLRRKFLDEQEIEKLAMLGLQEKDILFIKQIITYDEYISKKEIKFNQLDERKRLRYFLPTIQKGLMAGHSFAVNCLFNAMKKGNVVAIFFYLINRFPDSWKSVNKADIVGIQNELKQLNIGGEILKDGDIGKLAGELIEKISTKKTKQIEMQSDDKP